MHRNTMLVLAAGLTGAITTAAAGLFFTTPAHATSPSFAITEAKTANVDVLKLLERMLDMEAYATERDNETRVWNDQVTAIANERDGFLATLQEMDPAQAESPEAQSLYMQYQSAAQRFNQIRQQASVAIDQLAARQLSRAYQEVHAAVQEVAQSEGYDRVFSSRMTTDNIDAGNTNVVVQEVLLRPLIYDAMGTDLTPVVMAKLGIPEQPEPTAEESGPAQPATETTDPAGDN